MLQLTGGALAGTLLGCSDSSSLNLDRDAAAPQLLDGGHDGLPPAADLGAPDAGRDAATEDAQGPLFFLHFSDIHIGGGALALPALQFALSTVRRAFPGTQIVATGDLVESGIDVEDWVTYRDTLDAAGLTAQGFIETPGNHDALLNSSLSNYLAHTLSGRAGHGLYGIHHRQLDGRRVRIVALNTASSRNVLKDQTGYLRPEQVDELIETIDLDPDPVFATLVLGHHPIPSPMGLAVHGTDTELRRLLSHTSAAAYLHGHVHTHVVNWEGRTLMAQAPSLGNPSHTIPGADIPGFNLFALDDGPVARPVYHNGDPAGVARDWPVVMITRPAEPKFGAAAGGFNPWSQPLRKGSNDNRLHAGVFAPDTDVQARFRLDDQPWQQMSREAGYFSALFAAPDAESCVVEVEGRTADGATAIDRVELMLV